VREGWSGTKTPPGRSTLSPPGKFGTDGEVADVDGDTATPTSWPSKAIAWCGTRVRSGRSTFIAAAKLHDIEVAEFRRDSRPDIVCRNQGSFGSRGDELFLFRQESPGRWSRQSIAIPNGRRPSGCRPRSGRRSGCRRSNDSGSRTRPSPFDLEWKRHEYGPGWDYPFTFLAAGDLNGDNAP